MNILFLANWKIQYGEKKDRNLLPSDCCYNDKFWFFQYFHEKVKVDVIDTRSIPWIERIEKNYLRIYIMQTIRVLPKLKKYDLVISHGTTSGIFLAFLHRLFRLKMPKHIVFDISSFHKASEKGIILQLCRYASKKFDYLVYHTSTQKEYYEKFFPWFTKKSSFIPFGVDYEYWNEKKYQERKDKNRYIVCVGYRKRDWETLINAYEKGSMRYKLILIGNKEIKNQNQNIKIMDFLPIDDCMTYVSNALFCVLPLEWFNYSFGQMTLLQEMALKKAVLAADVPGIADYTSDGIVKYCAKDENDLLEKLEWMFDNANLMEEFGKKNREAVMMRYSEQLMAAEIEKICLKMTTKKEVIYEK